MHYAQAGFYLPFHHWDLIDRFLMGQAIVVDMTFGPVDGSPVWNPYNPAGRAKCAPLDDGAPD
jgi:hypothetical protein